jgi:hypothetical protein
MRRNEVVGDTPHYTFKSNKPVKKGSSIIIENKIPKFRGFVGGKV